MKATVTNFSGGLLIEVEGRRGWAPGVDIDAVFTASDPLGYVDDLLRTATPEGPPPGQQGLAPIGSQEVWAAGVTYLRSRVARVAESRDAGGATFYDLVYDAERPELFFKATPHRVVGDGGTVRIRADSTWNVPEPELVLAVSPDGRIIGCTVGNDMSSRSIEGENPLYLPQAKVYSACAGIGPHLVVTDALPEAPTAIRMEIRRAGDTAFTGSTTVSQIRRPLDSLVDWLLADNEFPHGVYLMTGTGIVPPDDFTLDHGDEIRIEIDGIGTLANHVV